MFNATEFQGGHTSKFVARKSAEFPDSVDAFRIFTGQLFSQVCEQLCQEFEREVSNLCKDAQTELSHAAELPRHPPGHEMQLHSLPEKSAEHYTSVASSTEDSAQLSSDPQLRDVVEPVHPQFVEATEVVTSAISSVSQSNCATSQHLLDGAQVSEVVATRGVEDNEEGMSTAEAARLKIAEACLEACIQACTRAEEEIAGKVAPLELCYEMTIGGSAEAALSKTGTPLVAVTSAGGAHLNVADEAFSLSSVHLAVPQLAAAEEEARLKVDEAERIVAAVEAAQLKAGSEVDAATAVANEARCKVEQAENAVAFVEAACNKVREEAAAASAVAEEARVKEEEWKLKRVAAETSRLEAEREVARRKEVTQNSAATKLQCASRGWIARQVSYDLQCDREARRAQERDALTKLHSALRVRSARRKLEELRLAPMRTAFDLRAGSAASYKFVWPMMATEESSFNWNVKVFDELTIDLEIQAILQPKSAESVAQKVVVQRLSRCDTFVGSFSPAKDRRSTVPDISNLTHLRVDAIVLTFNNSFSWRTDKRIELTTVFL